jgi:MFS family permease
LAGLRETFGAQFRGLPGTFYVLLAGMFVNRLATFVATFLGLYLVRERGFAPDQAGRLVALFGVGVLVAGPLGGTLADAIGRRATMLLSLVSGAVAVGTIGFLTEPAPLAVFAFLAALTSEMYRPAISAAIADLVPPPERARAYGLVYWTVNLGWAVSLSMAGFVAERSFLALFLADAGTCLAFALIIWRRVPETRPPGLHAHSPLQGLAVVFRDGVFVTFLVLNLAALAIFVQFQLAVPIDMNAHGVGPSVFSMLMGLNGLGVVVLQPLVGPWLRSRDSARLLAASALLFGLGFGLNAVGGSVPLYLVGVTLWTVGEVIGFPAGATLVADLAPVELRGRYQGAFSMSWGVAFALAPLLAGEVMAGYGARTLWLGCLALGITLAGLHLAVGPARNRRLAALGVRRGGATPYITSPPSTSTQRPSK